MKHKILLFVITAAIFIPGCSKDDAFLDKEPTNLIPEETLWESPDMVLSLLGDLYNRYYDFATIESWSNFSRFNDAFPSEYGSYGQVQNNQWSYTDWSTWDYGYIRDMNLFIEKCAVADKLQADTRNRFSAEARFLRASYYFEMVKRMGGVPLILKPEEYDFSGDPTYLQHPRETEAALYDFVISEAEAVKDSLPADVDTKSRATKAAALAMECRAALYAGSIAKYGASTPTVTLSGGEVGIPASRADGYYTTALTAAQAIIEGQAGSYGLYKNKPDLADNFASIFTEKSNNPEVIFVEDYQLQSGKVHGFTVSDQPKSISEDLEGGRLNPSLNLVEQFEMLDNTYAPLATTSGSDYMYYDNIGDIFAGRDYRLAGTVILPGSTFKGQPLDIWAGFQLMDGSTVTGDAPGQQKEIDNVKQQVVGFDGPINGYEFITQTGFYIRKYLDPKVGSGQRGVQSDVWFVRYRYAEVLLNAAEAAFELGDLTSAKNYMNEVRERAGLTTPLAESDITFDRIVHERKVEFAFEGLFWMDMKRWRLAHIIWDGNPVTKTDLVSNIGSATKRYTQPWGLWPYKVYDPGGAHDGQWIFKEVLPNRVTNSDRFRLGNYYSYIGDDVINNNPTIVRNPNQ